MITMDKQIANGGHLLHNSNHSLLYRKLCKSMYQVGVYKQWTGLLEWWNSGMVDWIVFVLIFIVCHIISTLLCFHLTS